MYIGLLNDRLSGLEWRLTHKNGTHQPPIQQNGNPFSGETLSVPWKSLFETGIDLHVSLPGSFFIDTLEITLDEACSPTRAALYNADKSMLLGEYCAETGKTISEKVITLTPGEQMDAFVLEISVSFTDAAVKNIALFGADLSGTALFPTPDSMKNSGKTCPISIFDSFSSDCENGISAVHILSEKLIEKGGCVLTEAENGKIRLHEDASIPENGYKLSVCENHAEIAASDLRGFVYACEVFIKLIHDGEICCCQIEDKPRAAFRGVHLYLPAANQMDFARRLIKYLISPMGYNTVIMEIAGAMEFKSHPEINEGFRTAVRKAREGLYPAFPHCEVGGGDIVPQADVAALADYIRSFGLDFIPEIQSLGHVQFMTHAHPDIAERPADMKPIDETDSRLADVPPDTFYAHCYCPSNEKSYEILYDLMDEIIAVTRPRHYVHMGHDEVYQIGVCPVCRTKDPAQLYADDVNRLYNRLAEKGLKMMIWADMLQPVSDYKTVPAADLIPKDIVMLDFIWYFHTDKDIEDNLLKKGFNVIMGNMYSSHYPRYNKRLNKRGMIGGEPSAWTGTNEYDLAKEGKLYDFIFSAEMLWSAAYHEHLRRTYNTLIARFMPEMRQNLSGRRYPSLSADAQQTVLIECAPQLPPVPLSKPEFSLSLNKCCDSLIFEHTASQMLPRIPWIALDVIAHYKITYADGETISVPVEYGGNISRWDRRRAQPFPGMYYRHNGYSAVYLNDPIEKRLPGGQVACFYRYEWINPRPDAVIASVELINDDRFDTAVMISALGGVNIR